MPREETIAGLRADLAVGRERLMQSLLGISEEQFKRRPETDASEPEARWSIAEVLADLLATERLWAARIALALAQDGVAVTRSRPEDRIETVRAARIAPVPQLIHGLLAARRETERLLDQAAALDNGLGRGVIHPVDGRQTVAWMVRARVIAVEAERTAQIEGLRAVVGATEAPGNG